MEYSAASTSNRLWYVETRETARLLQVHNWDEVKEIVIQDNLYQQKAESRLKNEFGWIQKRLKALPDELIRMIISSDINTAKIITFVSCMVTDRLLFEFMYEVYRNKVYFSEEEITDADWNIFFKDKQLQSEKVATFSEETKERLRQSYFKMMYEAGLLSNSKGKKDIIKPIIDQDLRFALQTNAMDKYIVTLTGEM